MSKKEYLANIICTILPDTLVDFLSNFSGRKNDLTILAYHRVLDFDDSFPFDIELISARPDQFEEQLKYIKKYYNPLTMEQLCELHKNKSVLPDKSIVITFDDGFIDNYNIAFPLLKKYEIPATIFVSTGYIGSESTFWFDKLACLVLNNEIIVSENNLLFEIINNNTSSSKRLILEQCLEKIKSVSDSDRLSILNDLFDSNKNILDNSECAKYSSILSWDNVKEMNKSLMSFGSHTVSHPVLSQLSESEKYHEMTDSKRMLEDQLKIPIETIAYPVGTESAFDKSVIESAKKSGYELGITYVHGTNKWPLLDPFTIRRLHVEHYTSIRFFKCMLSLPNIFKY